MCQGLAFLDKSLFSSYVFNPPAELNASGNALSSQSSILPPFQISLTALLETLQIFGVSDPTSTNPNRNPYFTSSNAFNTSTLGLGGTCRLSYSELGAPFTVTLSEADVLTSCEIMTFEPDSEADEEMIPLQRDSLTLKVIMPGSWLAEAMTELSSTNPEILLLTASATTAPFFSFQGLGGAFGDSMVEYQPEDSKQLSSRPMPAVSETFVVNAPGRSRRVKQRYRFELIKKAARAMALASKVSIRGDRQGVLSLQFMIELDSIGSGGGVGGARDAGSSTGGPGGRTESSGKVSFIDYRFVPLIDEDEDREEDGNGEDNASEDEST